MVVSGVPGASGLGGSSKTGDGAHTIGGGTHAQVGIHLIVSVVVVSLQFLRIVTKQVPSWLVIDELCTLLVVSVLWWLGLAWELHHGQCIFFFSLHVNKLDHCRKPCKCTEMELIFGTSS